VSVATYRPPCNHCAGTGNYALWDFGEYQGQANCPYCKGSGKGPAPDDCKACRGEGQWNTQAHPDAEVDTEYCEACHGTGQAPDFDGAGIA
jgi:DnaJ-class molecular chaperone